MKHYWLAGIIFMAAAPCVAQTAEAYQKQLDDKERELSALRERIGILERELTPRKVGKRNTVQPAAQADAQEDSNRALERTLVRENGMLLSPLKLEMELNYVYSRSEIREIDFRRDASGPALTLRVGLPLRLQLEMTLPYVVERRRAGADVTDSSGVGDFSVSLSHQFLVEQGSAPALIGTLGYQASTGRNTLFEDSRGVALGSGFKTAHLSLTALKRVDPLVFFGTYSFAHPFPKTINGIEVDPGHSHGIRVGTGLATGPDTSLRAALNMTWFGKAKVGGVTVPQTDGHSAMLELGGSVVLNESTALDVLIGAGLTSNAPKYRIGIALPIRLGQF